MTLANNAGSSIRRLFDIRLQKPLTAQPKRLCANLLIQASEDCSASITATENARQRAHRRKHCAQSRNSFCIGADCGHKAYSFDSEQQSENSGSRLIKQAWFGPNARRHSRMQSNCSKRERSKARRHSHMQSNCSKRER